MGLIDLLEWHMTLQQHNIDYVYEAQADRLQLPLQILDKGESDWDWQTL